MKLLYWFSVEITVFQVDLGISGVSEEQEEEPGKYIGVNNDDDNANSIADYAETGTVTGEDDLVEIDLSITPVLSSGSAGLEAWYQGDVCPIKLWLNPTKGCELTLYQAMEGHSLVAWNLSQETVPEKLYVEGYRAGDVVLDFSCNNVAFSDSVVFHVVDHNCEDCQAWIDHPRTYLHDCPECDDEMGGCYSSNIEITMSHSHFAGSQAIYPEIGICGTPTAYDVNVGLHRYCTGNGVDTDAIIGCALFVGSQIPDCITCIALRDGFDCYMCLLALIAGDFTCVNSDLCVYVEGCRNCDDWESCCYPYREDIVDWSSAIICAPP